VIVIDDYAHHPTKIRATLSAARSRYPDREIWAVWQPHTYSRTKALFDQFAAAFDAADHVAVTGIYPAREPVDPDFSSRQVVEQMQHKDAVHTGSLNQTEDYLLEHLRPGSVLIVMSAGDADQISNKVMSALERRSRPS
jgi:UDP-N-acetylmuramate--alanine ligase